jgi:hypothetical protein
LDAWTKVGTLLATRADGPVVVGTEALLATGAVELAADAEAAAAAALELAPLPAEVTRGAAPPAVTEAEDTGAVTALLAPPPGVAREERTTAEVAPALKGGPTRSSSSLVRYSGKSSSTGDSSSSSTAARRPPGFQGWEGGPPPMEPGPLGFPAAATANVEGAEEGVELGKKDG